MEDEHQCNLLSWQFEDHNQKLLFSPATDVSYSSIPVKQLVVLCGILSPLPTRCAVLVLAGIDLIFFTVASRGLWFGFVLKSVLIIWRYSRCC